MTDRGWRQTSSLLLASLALLLLLFPINRAYAQQENHFEAMLKVVNDYLENSYQGVIDPEYVYENTILFPDPDYYIVDLRYSEDYQAASITGSVNIPYYTVVESHQIDKLPRDKKIILISYSGHMASRVAAFWGLLGYHTIAMENGFGGWNQILPCNPANHQLTTEATEATEIYPLPEFYHEVETLKEMIMIRGKDIFGVEEEYIFGHEHDFGRSLIMARISGESIMLDLRKSELYNKGHFGGAINIPFNELTTKESLSLLPTDKEIILICSNGFESSQADTILKLLGYTTSVSRFGLSVLTDNEELIGDRLVICKNTEMYPTIQTRINVQEAGPG